MLARSTSQNSAGALGGVTLGYNWQRGTVVVGVEGDWSWTGLKATSVTTLPPCCFFPAVKTTAETRTDWLATLRGRIGMLAAPQTLLFVTGGLALGEIKTSVDVAPMGTSSCANNSLCAVGNASATRVGWTAGAGIEHAVAGNWTVKVEYLHYDLGSVSYRRGRGVAGIRICRCAVLECEYAGQRRNRPGGCQLSLLNDGGRMLFARRETRRGSLARPDSLLPPRQMHCAGAARRMRGQILEATSLAGTAAIGAGAAAFAAACSCDGM